MSEADTKKALEANVAIITARLAEIGLPAQESLEPDAATALELILRAFCRREGVLVVKPINTDAWPDAKSISLVGLDNEVKRCLIVNYV